MKQQKFIEKAIKVHGYKYDYSLVEYVNNHTKVKIKCPEHGVFEQTPGSHTVQKSKCPSCSSIKLDTKSFIEKSKQKHGNKYDYSKSQYVNSRSKIIITCPKHGDFSILARAHYYLGQGCKSCGLESKEISFEEFIIRSKIHHGDKFQYPKQAFNGITSTIKIICPEHGEFTQKAYSHSGGHGCPQCARIFNTDKQRLTTNEVIKHFKEVHGNKYDYSQVEYSKSNKKVKIICKDHGPFHQTPNNHKNGQRCPHCGDISRKSKLRDTWEEVYPELIKVHGDKYVYDKSTFIKTSSKMKVYCKIHNNNFKIAPSQLKQGQGCYHCGIDKIKTFLTKDWESTFDLIKQTHGDRYKYNVKSYKGRKEPMEIICAEHGAFMQEPSIHIGNHGCPKCGVISGHNLQRGTLEKFIKRARKMHGDLYDYSNARYIDVSTDVEIICKEHGSFFMSPNSHTHSTQSRGCPKCYTSSGERLITVFLEKHEVKYETQKKFDDLFSFKGKSNRNKLKCDFYLPTINTVIEYNGKQHYTSIDIFGGKKSLEVRRKNDRIKQQYCVMNHINFEVIRYDEDVETRMNEIIEKYTR